MFNCFVIDHTLPSSHQPQERSYEVWRPLFIHVQYPRMQIQVIRNSNDKSLMIYSIGRIYIFYILYLLAYMFAFTTVLADSQSTKPIQYKLDKASFLCCGAQLCPNFQFLHHLGSLSHSLWSCFCFTSPFKLLLNSRAPRGFSFPWKRNQ